MLYLTIYTKRTIKQIEDVLRGELKETEDFVNGKVYRYELCNQEGKIIDSCGGFYGDDFANNGLLETAGYTGCEIVSDDVK